EDEAYRRALLEEARRLLVATPPGLSPQQQERLAPALAAALGTMVLTQRATATATQPVPSVKARAEARPALSGLAQAAMSITPAQTRPMIGARTAQRAQARLQQMAQTQTLT